MYEYVTVTTQCYMYMYIFGSNNDCDNIAHNSICMYNIIIFTECKIRKTICFNLFDLYDFYLLHLYIRDCLVGYVTADAGIPPGTRFLAAYLWLG